MLSNNARINGHKSLRARLFVGSSALAILLVFTILLSVSVGPVPISMENVLSVLLTLGPIETTTHSPLEFLIVTELRLPRIIVGLLVGIGLSVAGVTMQALFRNPMADPGIIGISAGGSFGAVVAIALNLDQQSIISVPACAFIGSIVSAMIVYSFGHSRGYLSMPALLLAGVAVSAFFSSLISAIVVLEKDSNSVREILFWLAGGLDSRSWDHVMTAGPLIILGAIIIVFYSRDLNLLNLNDSDAKALGVNINFARPLLIILSALLTAMAVAVSGTIIFVGLITPHMLRLIVGPDHRILVPLSALAGAIFVVLADTLARTMIQPAELQVGMVTSFLGAPFFLFLLVKNKSRLQNF
ncbi:MAG: FecCD family ABC transporter permease [Dehalococcoidia bacterium]